MLTQTSKNANRRHVHKRIRKKVAWHLGAAALECVSLVKPYLRPVDRRLEGRNPPFTANSAEGKKGEKRTRQPGCGQECGQAYAEAPRPRGSRKLCSTGAATFITDGSRPWPSPPAKPGCSSR